MPQKDEKNQLEHSIIYFYGSYGLFYVLAILLHQFLPNFIITFWIAEKNQQVNYIISWAEIFDVIFLSFVFSINCLKVFRYLQVNLDKQQFWIEILFILAMIFHNFGVIVHLVANQLDNYIYTAIDEGYTFPQNTVMENLALGAYYWDEIFSHICTGIGFFLFVGIFVWLELKNTSHVARHSKWNSCLGYLTGAGIAMGLIEGQAGLIFLNVSTVFFVIITKTMKNQKYAMKPFTKATLWMIVGYCSCIIIYMILTSVKPTYPYLYQMSELMK